MFLTALLAAQSLLAPACLEAAQLVRLSFSEASGTATANAGTLGGTFQLTTPVPARTPSGPIGFGSAVDFGTVIGNYGVDSAAPMGGNLPRFTITGWLNCRNATTGAGGNRIVRNYVSGAHGIDLVMRSDGSLDMGVNAFASSAARSSGGRIPVSATAAAGNWRFFAVSYDSTLGRGNVRYYFGSSTADAAFDRDATLTGAVGPNVGILTVGAANPPARTGATDRMFRGMMDEIAIFDTVLSPAEIVAVQRAATPPPPPVAPIVVSLVGVDRAASEPGLDTGLVRIMRTGGTTNLPLTVNLAWTGGAVNGTDYALQPATVVIPAGATNVDLTVTPLDDLWWDPETVIATVQASANYTVGPASSATINLLDNETFPIFDALEIFDPIPTLGIAGPLVIPPVNYTGGVQNDTRVFPPFLPPGTIASIVLPLATVTSVTAAGGGFEVVLDVGAGETVTTYTHLATGLDPIAVGDPVRMVGWRTIAAGPIVADVIRVRPAGAPGGIAVGYLYQGVVSQVSSNLLNSAPSWNVGGVDFVTTNAAPGPTDVALTAPLVVGTSTVLMEFLPNAAAPVVGPPPASLFDAAEIFPPVAAVLAVPAPLFRNAQRDTTAVPGHVLPLGTIVSVVMPGATVTAVNTDPVTGGVEYVINAGTEIRRVYSAPGSDIEPGITVGSVVRVVATRTVRYGPIVINVMRLRANLSPGVGYAFFYQGVVTRADAGVWTIGGIDFNIVPATGALPTAISLLGPPTLGTTVAEVEFVVALGAPVPAQSIVSVTAPDAAAAEAGLDPGLFTLTRTTPTNLPLEVFYTVTGTASNGVDYTLLSGTAVIPAAAFSVDVAVTPIDDTVFDPAETVVLTVPVEAFYQVDAAANSATVIIADNDVPPFPQPLVQLRMNETIGTAVANSGTLGGSFTRTTPTPAWSANVQAGPGGASSLDYGTTTGNFGIDSAGVLPGLGNLPRFTITGWLNNRSTTVGNGGNRIVRNYVSGAHGIDLVYRNDGSLDLGVNAFPNSTARSGASRITTSATAAAANWRFFAVTYDSTLAAGQVRFFFGTPTVDAFLDVSRTYAAGPVGANVGSLTIGHVNAEARAGALDRMFRGLVDDVRIFGVVLTPAELVRVQRGTVLQQRLADGGLFAGAVDGLNVTMQDGRALLAWPTEQGQLYRVEFLDALGGTWQVLSPEQSGNGATMTLEDAVKDQAQRFYRVFRLGTP